MRSRIQRWWRAAGEHPRRFLAAVLLFEVLVCLMVVMSGKFEDPLPQFDLGANEIAVSHHIQSTFLPIGYPILLGTTEIVGGHWGVGGQHAVMYAMHIGLLLITTLLMRALLRRVLPLRLATAWALLVSLHPEILQKIKKVSDADLTALLMLWILLTCVRLRERTSWARALWAGIALGCGVLVRPNLALLAVLMVWALWPQGWRRRVTMACAGLAMAVAAYCAVTGEVHGRPFIPQNGTYNMYAGANAFTQPTMLKMLNAEDSIPEDMLARGYVAPVNWLRPSDVPGVTDGRDLKWTPMYKHWAVEYIEAHPLGMVKLSALKLVTLMRPETKRYKFTEHQTLHSAAWLANKSVQAMVLPVWIGVIVYAWRRRRGVVSPAVVILTVAYVLPFVLINADPRFRLPLDVVLLMDLVRVFYLLRREALPVTVTT